jgi:sugar-specific transcriptional regulator TrmB
MVKTLMRLGLTDNDTQIFIYLTTNGPKRAEVIAQTLKLKKQNLYRTLKRMRTKGIINVSNEYPARFSAVVMDEVLDLLGKVKIEQQRLLEENKEELLSTWRSITKEDRKHVIE